MRRAEAPGPGPVRQPQQPSGAADGTTDGAGAPERAFGRSRKSDREFGVPAGGFAELPLNTCC
jgi:hypothetical protein